MAAAHRMGMGNCGQGKVVGRHGRVGRARMGRDDCARVRVRRLLHCVALRSSVSSAITDGTVTPALDDCASALCALDDCDARIGRLRVCALRIGRLRRPHWTTARLRFAH